jgi:hypothetical protein
MVEIVLEPFMLAPVEVVQGRLDQAMQLAPMPLVLVV